MFYLQSFSLQLIINALGSKDIKLTLKKAVMWVIQLRQRNGEKLTIIKNNGELTIITTVTILISRKG